MANVYDQIFHDAYWELSEGATDEERAAHAQEVMGKKWNEDQANDNLKDAYGMSDWERNQLTNEELKNTVAQRAKERYGDLGVGPANLNTHNQITGPKRVNLNKLDQENNGSDNGTYKDIYTQNESNNRNTFLGSLWQQFNNNDENDNRSVFERVFDSFGYAIPDEDNTQNNNSSSSNYFKNLSSIEEAKNAARKEWRETANDYAFGNLLESDPQKANLIGRRIEDSSKPLGYRVEWIPEEERSNEANEYWDKEKNMNFYYDNGIKDINTLAPYLSEEAKSVMDRNNTLANQNGTQTNYWMGVGLDKDQRKNQFYQSMRGPANNYGGYGDKWADQERQGGDTENYGNAGERMYDDQDYLWLQQGYHPDTGKTRNTLNEQGITTGPVMQTLEDFETEQLDQQPVNVSELFLKDPNKVVENFTNGGVDSLNNLSYILTHRGGLSPLYNNTNMLHDLLTQTIKDKTKVSEAMSNLEKSVASQNQKINNAKKQAKDSGEQIDEDQLNELENNNNLMSNSIDRNQAMLNTIMMAANMAKNGRQSYFNPNNTAVKQYYNFAPNNDMAYNIYENPYELTENDYSGFGTDALINALKQSYADPFDEKDSYKILNKNALQEAIRRARR